MSGVVGSFSSVGNITGGSGTNSSVFGSSGSLSGTLNAGSGSTNTLDLSANGSNLTVNVTAANAGNVTGVVASFLNVGNVTGGSGNHSFVFSDAATLSGALNGGGGGTNTLDSSAYSTTEFFLINGTNAGSGTPVGAFSNIQSLIGGGGGNNDFAFNDGGSLGGSLGGGSGVGNTLDYSSGWTGNVTVDLQIGAASGVAGLGAGAVSNIQSVLGASGGGTSFYDLLIGAGGNYLQGGTGRRNLLVAGGAASVLVGGDGEDLIIAGSTTYDTDPTLANWQQIANYWTGSDDFATRVSNLLSGTGVPILDPTAGTGTVVGNGGGNALTGNGGVAAIFTDGADTISGFDPNSQQITITP